MASRIVETASYSKFKENWGDPQAVSYETWASHIASCPDSNSPYLFGCTYQEDSRG